MKKIIAILLMLLFLFMGCKKTLQEPGNAFPVIIQYEETLYFHKGAVLYELPENFEKIGTVNCVDTHSIAKNFEGNEEGYIYKNKNGELLFKYKEWNKTTDGEKEPFLVLVPEE